MKKILITLILLGIFLPQVFALDTHTLDTKLQTLHQKIEKKYTSNTLKTKLYNAIKKRLQEQKNSQNSKTIEYILQNIESYQQNNGFDSFLKYSAETGKITHYTVIQQEFWIGKNPYKAIRSFVQNNTQKLLIVHLENFETAIVDAKYIVGKNTKNISTNSSFGRVQNRLLRSMKLTKNYLQNSGILGANNPKENEIYFTADFCPSEKHGFEKEIIENFIHTGHKNIAIALTTAWYNNHRTDFEKLLEWQTQGKLNITWINHTKTHSYNPKVPYSKTFILTPGLDLHNEIISVEQLLISHGQVPSVFLRFPGLISNIPVHKKVISQYNLIPLGSSAWLAKGEKVRSGSIILIHGNKNEPRGIPLMQQILKNKKWKYGKLESVLK